MASASDINEYKNCTFEDIVDEVLSLKGEVSDLEEEIMKSNEDNFLNKDVKMKLMKSHMKL